MSSEFNWQNVVQGQEGPIQAEPAQQSDVEQVLNQLPNQPHYASQPQAPVAPAGLDFSNIAESPYTQEAQPPQQQPIQPPQQQQPVQQQPVQQQYVQAPPTPQTPPAPMQQPYEVPAQNPTPAAFHEPAPIQAPPTPANFQLPTPQSQPTAPPQPGMASGASLSTLNNPVIDESMMELASSKSNEFLCEMPTAATLDGVHLDDLLRMAVEQRASDIHITIGLPPMIRLDGDVAPLPFKVVKPLDSRRLVTEILTDENVQKFETSHELDFSHSVRGCGRFRVNVYMQRGCVAASIRTIPQRIPSFDELGLPESLRNMSKRTSGLILVTGPTGSGKSTSIASMLDDVNESRHDHIITIEDPIEYLHQHKKCMVNQREMHSDTYSFHNALRAVLREDPDIILVGELRDLETIEAALTLAETGHLVFGTLHTRNAPATIDRIVDVFPSDQQDQIRILLANTLEGVVSQQLLTRLGGGRVAALEVMIGLPGVKNLIREGKTHQLYSIIETNKSAGMFTMDFSLAQLYRSGQCSYDDCLMAAVDKDNFARLAKSAA